MQKKILPPKTFKERVRSFLGLLMAVALALLFRSVLWEPYHIPSASMEPSLLIGDYLFTNKYPYGYSRHSFPFSIPIIPKNRIFYTPPQRGDVVIFKTPTDNRTDFIKRLIALPGETVQMINGRLYINGQMVPRELISSEMKNTPYGIKEYKTYQETLPGGLKHLIYEMGDDLLFDNTELYRVPENHFFVMGDNRDNSQDSRFFGYLPAENLTGQANFIFYSNGDPKSWFFQFWRWGEILRLERFFTKIK